MPMKKPCRLELNNSGAWKLIGKLDADDETQSDLVLNAAEKLIASLHNNPDPKHCPTMRVCTDDPMPCVLMRWDLEHGWVDATA